MIGTVLAGRFRVDQMLGAGGMGFVVAATHLELGHRVAIKLMRDELLSSPAHVERFMREARAVVKLRTEHVCKVLDIARLEAGAPLIVMELLEGVDLSRVQNLPPALAVEYVMQACIALAEAHALGIVHRDLKPANLFVTRRLDGSPLLKVLDFGIAKAAAAADLALTHTRMVMGSPGYMSPEQLESARDVDAGTDIWALGVSLYQLISGRMPFGYDNPTLIAIRIANEPPAALDADPALAAVILRCLEKPRAHRFTDVAELALALAPFAGPNGVALANQVALSAGRPSTSLSSSAQVVHTGAMTAASIAPSVARSSAPPAKRSRGALVAVLAVLAVGGIVAAIMLAGSHDKPVARDAAVVAIIVPDARLPDAGLDAPADAEVVVEVAADAGPPTDAAKPSRHPPPTMASMMAMYQQSFAKMKPMCQQMKKNPSQLAMMPPAMAVMCKCVTDPDQAEAAIASLPADLQGPIRAMCSQVKK